MSAAKSGQMPAADLMVERGRGGADVGGDPVERAEQVVGTCLEHGLALAEALVVAAQRRDRLAVLLLELAVGAHEVRKSNIQMVPG